MIQELLDLLQKPRQLAWSVIPGLHDQDTGEAYTGSRVVSNLLGTDEDSTLSKVLGFGAEAALDPVNLLGGVALKGLSRLGKVAKEANLGREALLAKGAMPAEIADLTIAGSEAGPARMYHGTPHAFEGTPDLTRANPASLYGPGYYTTQGPELANEYAHNLSSQMDYLRGRTLKRVEDVQDILERAKISQMAGSPIDPKDHRLWNPLMTLVPDTIPAPTTEQAIGHIANKLESLQGQAASLTPHANIRMNYLDVRKPFNMSQQFAEDEARRIFETATGKPFMEGGPGSGEDIWNMIAGEKFNDVALTQEALRKQGYDSITHLPGMGSGLGGGGEAERVWIALHPHQIYSPFIAPAVQKAPSLSPWLAALGGYNTGRAGLQALAD